MDDCLTNGPEAVGEDEEAQEDRTRKSGSLSALEDPAQAWLGAPPTAGLPCNPRASHNNGSSRARACSVHGDRVRASLPQEPPGSDWES